MDHQILLQLGYSAAVMAATFLIHGIMIMAGRMVFRSPSRNPGFFGALIDTVRLVLIAVWLLVAHSVSIAVWAFLFHHVDMNATFEEALYFAFTSYTTLGFGDIIPSLDWRLLTGASALNGLLLFGLSAATLVDATYRMRNGPFHLRK